MVKYYFAAKFAKTMLNRMKSISIISVNSNIAIHIGLCLCFSSSMYYRFYISSLNVANLCCCLLVMYFYRVKNLLTSYGDDVFIIKSIQTILTLCNWYLKVMTSNYTFSENSQNIQSYWPLIRKCLLSLILWNHTR